MNHKVMRVMGILLAVMAVTAVLGFGISWARAEGTAAPAQATAAQTGAAFTYQGSLENNGSPVNGSCDMQFSLYDAASGGAQAGSTVTKSSVSVSDGLFAVELDFGDQFQGDARYLQISTRCPAGSGSYTALNGRVPLTAAPYALSLRPGAVISGAVSAVTSTLKVVNSNASGPAMGVFGQTDSADYDAAGLYGYAAASSGTAKGVYARADSPSGMGVFGFASSTSGGNYGVVGQTWSPQGIGIYGVGIMTGTVGYANSSTGTSYGVHGTSVSASGYGVYGENAAGGYGVYSEGNAHVEGQLTWKPMTSYLSITPSAFQPSSNGDSYFLGGYYLRPDGVSAVTFYAPVELPHGATVTEFTFHWSDLSASNGSVQLIRNDPYGSDAPMVAVSTSGNAGPSSTTETTISNATIDNSRYGYYIELILPDSNVFAYEIFIKYTIDQPH